MPDHRRHHRHDDSAKLGRIPPDVDMRLKIPTPNGDAWVHSQTSASGTVTVGGVTITVDVDDRNGYGPEVLTIPRFPYPGDYYFDVFPYTWEAGPPPSPPVRVTVNLAGESRTFTGRLNDTTRFLWIPFKICRPDGSTGHSTVGRILHLPDGTRLQLRLPSEIG